MNHPYPDEATKIRLANVCGVSVAQVRLLFLKGNNFTIFRFLIGLEINVFVSRKHWKDKVNLKENQGNVQAHKLFIMFDSKYELSL